MQVQLPQPAPQPVRMVNSAIVEQPAAAVSRIARSVTPLQRHTYMAGIIFRNRSHLVTNENSCQQPLRLDYSPWTGPFPPIGADRRSRPRGRDHRRGSIRTEGTA